jgi:NAD dependent epimerase/dehydratase family enzyme
VLKKNNKKLEAFISASAIGIYGAVNGQEICTEQMAPANDFLLYLSEVEESLDFIENLNIRTVKIQMGLVLKK